MFHDQALGVKSGVVSTGNSLDHTEMDDTLMLANGTAYLAFATKTCDYY